MLELSRNAVSLRVCLLVAATLLPACGGGPGTTPVTATIPSQSAPTLPPANRAPTIAGTPATAATVGQAYSFQPNASDADGNTLTFSIVNKPSWASFNATSGQLGGTPGSGDVGTNGGITITVSDGNLSAALPAFSIQVSAQAPANRAPQISGTPATSVVATQSYAFQPTASDADGNLLTFSIANKPAWANFNAATGQLSGTPASGDIGTYGNIVISVSDGIATVSLPAFNLSVAPASSSTGSAAVSWTAPTLNDDGSALTNLAGFNVHYGQSANTLSQVVQVPGANAASFLINNLASGTWYFALTAYTTSGAESALTGVVTKTIN